jgi:hypothetical protein
MDVLERSVCKMYREKGIDLSGAGLRIYINLMIELGQRDEELSGLWVQRLDHLVDDMLMCAIQMSPTDRTPRLTSSTLSVEQDVTNTHV